jgi:predicted enzyme related to lactoylglutathione lyase
MSITEIAFSSYAVNDVGRARSFYEGVLGLKPSSVFEENGMAFIEYQIGAHYFVIGKGAPAIEPGPTGGVVVFETDDFDGLVKKLKDAGAPFVMDAQDTGACHMALVKDPDGNQLMIHRRKNR